MVIRLKNNTIKIMVIYYQKSFHAPKTSQKIKKMNDIFNLLPFSKKR